MTSRATSIAVFGLLVLLILRVASMPTANLSFFLLAAYATLGRREAIQALAMCWLFTMVSSGLAPPASLGGVGRYAVFIAAFGSVVLRSGVLSSASSITKPVFATISLGFFLIVHSALLSPMPDVSILKAVSWIMVTATLLSAWGQMGTDERLKLFKQLYNGLVVIMLISVPLVVLPLGYIRNGTGFQGILNHPQAFGPTMAILGALAGSRLLTQRNPSWGYLGVFASCLVLILLSEARTAGVALILGLVIGLVVAPLLSGRKIIDTVPGLKSRRLWGWASIVLIVALVFSPLIYQKSSNFISKSGRAGELMTIAEAYDKSRGDLIDRLLANIEENPLTGIGFGIASNSFEMIVERDPVMGLPISASIEKGVLPLAVAEEVGLIGAFLVFMWFWMVVKRAGLSGFTPLTLTTTALLLNMGENIFFSPGGLGGLLLVFVCWASTEPLSLEAKSMKKRQEHN
tara:strand:+ start:7828 stop:9207 length:1380 start_codon:yes stop_codon:yes gene_type:complete